MRVAIITVAGISSRFNKGIPEKEKVLKAVYSENGVENTLLYHSLKRCSFADKIILVGGYKFEELYRYFIHELSYQFPQVVLVKNTHYEDLASGYSLYLGIKKALHCMADEVLFVEGVLDIDNKSFEAVISSEYSVLTYTNEPIYTNKAVVLYRDSEGRYKYAFNSVHGLLTINEPVSCILNSGQTWKFTDISILNRANEEFFRWEKEGTNLSIIQRYINLIPPESIELINLKRWVNCNTRDDYKKINDYWRTER